MKTDETLFIIADYAANKEIKSEEAYLTAKLALQDAIGCAILSLKFDGCKKLLGPIVKRTIVPNGSRVIGTDFVLDPVQAAFNLGTMIRFLDFNDTFLGKEWAHPSDNLGAILSLCDHLSQNLVPLTMKDLLCAMIKAYEIQGMLALSNSFNRIGFDHVIYVKVASSAITAKLLGASIDQIIDTLSNAFIDTGPLRTYRHFPNTGSRKSWAAGDQCARGLHFALLTMRGEMGYKSALTAPKWGLFEALFKGEPFLLEKPLDTYVMENILFKVSYPAEFHAQTAVEAAVMIHPQIKDRLNEVASIEIQTQESALLIIDKKGPLNNHADRDHCLQYMVAVALLTGSLTEQDYSDAFSLNPLIDFLRNKMKVVENKQFTKDYYDLSKKSITNAITINFLDGSTIGPITLEYPLGHRRRRKESLGPLLQKFKNNLTSHYNPEKVDEIVQLFNDDTFDQLPVSAFINHFLTQNP